MESVGMDPAEVGTPVARTGGRSFSETDETIKPADGTPSTTDAFDDGWLIAEDRACAR